MKTFSVAALIFGAAIITAPAQAQTGLGINAQYGLEVEEFQLGAELHIPFRTAGGFSIVPNFEYYLMDEPSLLSINGDVHYHFGGQYTRSFTPYAGLGLAITRFSVNDNSNTEVGLNLIGGANFRTTGRTKPFFQIEYRASDYDDLSIGGGLRFLL